MDTANTTLDTAAPSAGIVWAYRFHADGRAEKVPPAEVGATLAEHDGA
jgi:hypothetical protein